MTEANHESHGTADPSLERLLFFSDGVFAIAITLLAIELHPPHGWDGTFAMLIRQGWPMLFSFVISFAVVGVFWNGHRRIFLNMTRFTQGVFWLNLLLLGAIALMPFATTLTYQVDAGPEKFLIYLSLVAGTGIIQGLIYAYAAFVADVMRPRMHSMKRLAALAMMSLMPGAACGFSLMAFGGAPWWILAMLGGTVAALIAFAIFTGRRYPDNPPA